MSNSKYCRACEREFNADGKCEPCESGATTDYVRHLMSQRLNIMASKCREFVMGLGSEKRGFFLSCAFSIKEIVDKPELSVSFIDEKTWQTTESLKTQFDVGDELASYDPKTSVIIASAVNTSVKTWAASKLITFDEIDKIISSEEYEKLEMRKLEGTNNCHGCGKPSNKTCSRCKKAKYCSIACQRENWKYHKNVCVPIST